jgi:ATP-binding cassette subfamily B protein
VILGCTIATGALEPPVLEALFDGLTGGHGRALAWAVGGLLGIGLLREAFGGLDNGLTWRTRIGVHCELQEATITRLHTLPVRFHQREGVGALMTRLERGIQGFVSGLTEIAFNVLPALACLSIAVMDRRDWRLATLVLLFTPLPAIIAARVAPEQTRREKSLLDRWAHIYGRFNEVLHGILTVKSLAMEDAEKTRFLDAVSDANRVRGVARDARSGAARILVVMLAHVGAGGWLVLRGEVTVGTVVALLGYVGGLFGPVQGLTGIYQTVQKVAVSLDTVFDILAHADPLRDAPDAVELPPARGDVVFEDVHFRYDDHTPVLTGIDLHVRAGETVALVGPGGSGRTTMIGLIERLHDPTRGRVLVDGVDLRRLRQRSLREQIGVVLQEPVLFNDTVRAHIAYGRPDASAQIEAAARAANAHEFSAALPDGYDTVVGERGGRLSMGQRQRIAIARALIKDPPILILDEPTSALDAESEGAVQDALDTLMCGRTTFVIAHRLSTVVHADRILVLRDGRIAESGTHAELMTAAGFYAGMVRRQAGADVFRAA